MQINYTDRNLEDVGVLSDDVEIDLDLANDQDFTFEIPIIKGNFIPAGGIWYVSNSEFGGVFDFYTVITSSNIIRHEGRSFRGVLASKVVKPPAGEAYRYLSGNVDTMLTTLITGYGLHRLFVSDEYNKVFSLKAELKVPRYISVYDTLLLIGNTINKVLTLSFNEQDRHVHLKYTDRFDYSQTTLFNSDTLNFKITQTTRSVNHLICLGKGELEKRLVLDLYMDGDGNISKNQYFFGLSEYAQTYENTGSSTLVDLETNGIKKLRDLNKSNSKLDISENEISAVHIGDIVGGYEKITKTQIRTEVSNFIFKMSGQEITVDYKVGGENTEVAGVLPDIDEPYILPIASTSILGGIKIGNGLLINSNNELNLDLTELNNKMLYLYSISI